MGEMPGQYYSLKKEPRKGSIGRDYILEMYQAANAFFSLGEGSNETLYRSIGEKMEAGAVQGDPVRTRKWLFFPFELSSLPLAPFTGRNRELDGKGNVLCRDPGPVSQSKKRVRWI